MTTSTRRELRHQTKKYVVVDDKMYVRLHDEYVVKAYFTMKEAAKILDIPYYDAYLLCVRLGIQARANKGKKIRLTLEQLRNMSKLKNEV